MTGRQSQAWWPLKLKRAVRSGAVVPVLLMLPNVAWMLLYSPDADMDAKGTVPAALSIAEKWRGSLRWHCRSSTHWT